MDALLPQHGRIECRRCWSAYPGQLEWLSKDKKFKLVSDPAAWGAQNPRVLVLGITKGNTQSSSMSEYTTPDEFDEIAFKKFRDRLTEVLHKVGLANHVNNVSQLIKEAEQTYAWGSVIRCSLTGWDKKKAKYSGESGKVLPAFTHAEMEHVVSTCFATHLAHLPRRLELIVLLGNSDDYLEKMRALVARFCVDLDLDPQYEGIAYKTGGRLWVHVAHPSRGNGYYNNFMEGPPDVGQGRKRELARRAIGDFLPSFPNTAGSV